MAEVSAPASSGNLGPGFDMMGLALELRCHVTARTANVWSVEHIGAERLPHGETDAVLVSARAAVGESSPMQLTVNNDVPLARGLGSSSAARAAGAAAAFCERDGSFDPERVFEIVADFEGHGDNAAAAVYGGLVAVDAAGHPISLPVHSDWKVIVAIPNYGLATSKARSVLSPQVSRTVVVRNAGRLVALVEGLRSGSASTLRLAAGDELHEQPRATLHERAVELMAAARRGGAAHAAWSGAGPSILAFTNAEHAGEVSDLMSAAMADQGDVRELLIAAEGLRSY